MDLNTTIFPLFGQVGTLVNTIKVLIGGVFGLYLIILYLRLREYLVVKRLLSEIHRDIRIIAEHDRIRLPPEKENRMHAITKRIKDALKRKS